jgi:hypothetical protein
MTNFSDSDIHFFIFAGRNNIEITEKLVKRARLYSANSKITVFWPIRNSTLEGFPQLDLTENISFFDTNNVSISKIRNIALSTCVQSSIRYCIMIEDDIEIIDESIFGKYLELMSKFELHLAFYPFGGDANRVFNHPNYNLVISKSENSTLSHYICTCAKPCSHILIIDCNKNTCEFDENLKYFELRDFMVKCFKNSNVPFIGMFFDVPESYKYINTIKSTKIREIVPKEISNEQQKLVDAGRWEWPAETNISNLLKYAAKKLNIECKL